MKMILNIIKFFLFFNLALNYSYLYSQDKNSNWKPSVLFLLGGQSNMDGRGKSSELPKEFTKFPSSIRIWNTTDEWTELKVNEMFGPEIGFAFELAKKWPKLQIGLVKLGSSGTNMTLWAGKETDPKAKNEGPNGTLYITWIQMLKKAMKSAPEAQLKGVLWMQGESDAQDQALAEKYEANLKKLIDGVRKESEEKNLLFLIGKIQAKNYKFLHTVWKAEEDTSKKVPNVILVNTDNVDTDGLHFTAKGQLELGKLFAEEFIKSSVKSKNK